jgi:MFS family permease
MVGFLLFGGVLADRIPRRRLLIAADLIRAGALAAISVLSVTGALELWHVVALVIPFGIGEALFGPAWEATIPEVVPRPLLVQANSLNSLTEPISFRAAGPAVGGLPRVRLLGAGRDRGRVSLRALAGLALGDAGGGGARPVVLGQRGLARNHVVLMYCSFAAGLGWLALYPLDGRPRGRGRWRTGRSAIRSASGRRPERWAAEERAAEAAPL